jgi:hypothetical protein
MLVWVLLSKLNENFSHVKQFLQYFLYFSKKIKNEQFCHIIASYFL